MVIQTIGGHAIESEVNNSSGGIIRVRFKGIISAPSMRCTPLSTGTKIANCVEYPNIFHAN